MSLKSLRVLSIFAMAGILSGGSLFSVTTPLFAEEGRYVTATPFDHKLAGARLDLAFATPSGAPEKSAESLFVICRSFRYVKDIGGDRWQSAEETDRRRSGDCEDKAIWMYYRLKMAGYQDVRLVIGKFKKHKRELHVWVTYRDEVGNVCLADPTLQKRIWCLSDFSGEFYRALFSFDGTNRYLHSS